MWLRRMPLVVAIAAMSVSAAAQAPVEFQPYTAYRLDQEAQTVAIGDINGDGREDAAVTAWPSSLFVLYQLDSGTLASPVQLVAPNMPLGLAIGDINGDSRKDLAVGGTSGQVLIYYQQPDGSLDAPVECSAYGATTGIAIADLNSDGRADLAVCTSSWSAVFVLFQEPGGGFGLPQFYAYDGENARSIATLDYNSDARTDIALLVDGQICLLAQDASGGFAAPEYLSAQWSRSLAAGDVTGDGLSDLVYSIPGGQPDGAIGVYSRTGGTYALSVRTSYDFAQPLAIADTDSDGRNDVIAAHPGFDALSVQHQTADGALGDWSLYPLPYCNCYQPGALAVGDLNSDGFGDVAVADPVNGLVVLLHESVTESDTTAPVCTPSIEGTKGLNGWYVSTVKVTLNADDGPGGSGVKQTLYTVDGRKWVNYTGPVVISKQGATRFGYRAVDAAGNESEPKWIAIKVDNRKPALRLVPGAVRICPANGKTVKVPVVVIGYDTTSGLANLSLRVVDEYRTVQPTVVVRGCVVAVPLVASCNAGDTNGRTYTLVLSATDRAGNAESVTSTVTVKPTKCR